MAQRDPYEVLGVSRNSSADEIKSAYRRLARKYHPDVNPDDPSAEDKFKEVTGAYEILSDPDKKARFDQFGTTEDMPQDPFFSGGGGNIGDLFEMFFGAAGGGQRRRTMAQDGSDLRLDVEVSLLEVIQGVTKEVKVTRASECGSCTGTGVEGGGQPQQCGACQGMGVVSAVKNTFLGQVRTQTTCPKCQGSGFQITNPCKSCNGRGLKSEQETVSLKIPAGVSTGSTMHMPGHGDDGIRGGRPGDLYVVLHVQEDGPFVRDGQHLLTAWNISVAQAILGDEVLIDGVEGELELRIPAGVQPGQRLTLKGQGLPPLHGGKRGDLVVEMNVEIPKKVSETEAKLIREFAELRGERVPKDKEGPFGGLFGKKK
jgi:molecular chaperone DnaJ